MAHSLPDPDIWGNMPEKNKGIEGDKETSILNGLLNRGRHPVKTVIEVEPFDAKVGPIPYTVPLLKEQGRYFASGKTVLAERLESMISGESEMISAWCHTYFDLSDACLTFEDKVKVQPDCAMLKGIRGVVKTCDGEKIAIDAKAVYKSTGGRMPFEPRQTETVHYGRNGRITMQVNDVALFRLVKEYIEIDADQFKAMPGKALKRDEFAHNEQLYMAQIIRGEEVVHEIYTRLWPGELLVPFVKNTFRLIREEGKRKGMGLFLSEVQETNGQLRNFCIDLIKLQSPIYGYSLLRKPGRVLGAVEGNHMGYSKKH